MAKKSRCQVRGHNWKHALVKVSWTPVPHDVTYCSRCRHIPGRGIVPAKYVRTIDDLDVIEWDVE